MEVEFYSKIRRENRFKSVWSFTDFIDVNSQANIYQDEDCSVWGEAYIYYEGFIQNLPYKPTWLDVWTACDKLIRQNTSLPPWKKDNYSNYRNHIFIEDISLCSGNVDPDCQFCYELSTGS